MPLATSLDGVVPTQLRGLAFLALSDTGYVVSTAGTSDAGGGIGTATTTGSTVNCRIDSLGGGESEVADRVSDRSTHLIALPPQTDIAHADNFYSIGEDETYEITAVRERTREWMRLCEAVRR